jgi:hypothetical protein
VPDAASVAAERPAETEPRLVFQRPQLEGKKVSSSKNVSLDYASLKHTIIPNYQ